jgi:hypothetical protein
MRKPSALLEQTARHVVVDLETLAVCPHAQILSIGAVAFTPNGSLAASEFYAVVDAGGLNADRATDPDTLAWWVKQGLTAQGALSAAKRYPLEHALADLSAWMQSQTSDRDRLLVWGNGDDFDLAILADAYRQCRAGASEAARTLLEIPWHYWNGHNLRTLLAAFPDVMLPRQKAERKHIAVEDARHEARVLQVLLAEAQAARSALLAMGGA